MTYRLGIISLVLASLVSCSNQEGNLQLKLPKSLQEISGLQDFSDGSLLAVADERAEVFRIYPHLQKIEAFTQFGEPAARGDFEGIAVLADMLYLITSDGILLEQRLYRPPSTRENGDTNRPTQPASYAIPGVSNVVFNSYDTGMGNHCEVEGLAPWPVENKLLGICKTARTKALKKRLTIFSWSPLTPEETDIVISMELKQLGLKKFNPSGIAFNQAENRLHIVAARQRSYLEITTTGKLLDQGMLPPEANHRQTEGIAITGKSILYLADEGGNGRGKVTEYVGGF